MSWPAFLVAPLLVSFAACRDAPLPAPEELALGTFVMDLQGFAYVRGDTVPIAERLRGTACLRLEHWITLESRHLSWRRHVVLYFPRIPAPTGRLTETFDGLQSRDAFKAHGHLIHPLRNARVISGHADLSAVSIADIRGELRARLAEPTMIGHGFDAPVVVDTTTTHALLTLRGSFRADTGRGEQAECRRWWDPRTRS